MSDDNKTMSDDNTIQITPDILAAAAQWASQALEATIHCHPNNDDCNIVKHPYIHNLAADLACLEEAGDLLGWDRLAENYGNRDTLEALHLVEKHRDQLPPPRLTPDPDGIDNQEFLRHRQQNP